MTCQLCFHHMAFWYAAGSVEYWRCPDCGYVQQVRVK